METRALTSCSLLLLSFTLAVDCSTAQQWVGFNGAASVGATSRGGLLGPGTAFARIDADDYIGWATDPAVPGARVITGIDCIVQDQDAVLTPELFDVGIYPEDPFAPGFPLGFAGVVGALGLPGPAAPAAGVVSAAYVAVAFGAPIVMPIGIDVFIGLVFPPALAWPADGISFQVVLGLPLGVAFPTFDMAGPAMGAPVAPWTPANSYGAYAPLGGPAFYASRRQIWADIDSTAPGGVVTTMAAEATFPIAGAAPGTTSFMSGLHPDAAFPPLNPGRADDVGYVVNDDVAAAGSLVFFMADFGLGFELPMGLFSPGAVGTFCLPTGIVTAIGFLAGGTASNVLLIPPGARPGLLGLELTQQAVTFDLANGTLRGTPCGSQKM
jgi:hypothetical protein